MTQFVGVVRPVTALLIATCILMLGNGLLGVLIPLRAQTEGFSDFVIGLFGSAFYTGFVAGCLFVPAIIARVGHVRTFSALTALLTVTPLLHSLATDAIFWCFARMLAGVCIAGIFLVLESWLAAASETETRGRVLGIYLAVHFIALTIGMQLISVGPETGVALFTLTAILFSLGAVPIALTGTLAPPLPRKPKIRLGWLLGLSPAAAITSFLIGLTNGAFFSLTPLYGTAVGMNSALVAAAIAVAYIAGAALQFPIGSAADTYGRRLLLITTGALSALGGLALFAVANLGTYAVLVAMAIYGGASFSIYGLALAHANDLVHKKRAVEVSSGLMLIFSIGAAIGPTLAAGVMQLGGAATLFLFTALIHAGVAGVVFVRRLMRPVIPRRRRRRFQPITKVTTPAVYRLDPRAEPQTELPPQPMPEASIVDGQAVPSEWQDWQEWQDTNESGGAERDGGDRAGDETGAAADGDKPDAPANVGGA